VYLKRKRILRRLGTAGRAIIDSVTARARPSDPALKEIRAVLGTTKACLKWLQNKPNASQEKRGWPSHREDNNPHKAVKRIACHLALILSVL